MLYLMREILNVVDRSTTIGI